MATNIMNHLKWKRPYNQNSRYLISLLPSAAFLNSIPDDRNLALNQKQVLNSQKEVFIKKGEAV